MKKDPAGAKYDQEGSLMCQLGSTAPHIGLRVCYETRAFLFAKHIVSDTTKIYLNTAADTVYFGPDVSWGQAHRFPRVTAESELRMLRHLAFEETLLVPFMLACSISSCGLDTLSNLETIWTTLSENGRWSYHHSSWRADVQKDNAHCDKCDAMNTRVFPGLQKAWKFPTTRAFVTARQLSDNVAEEAYLKVLSGWEGRYSLFGWLWDYIHGKK